MLHILQQIGSRITAQMAVKNKNERLKQLTTLLEAHPEGLRKAEIARRIGVHRSTVGRYVDQLSLLFPIWERDNRIGIDSRERSAGSVELDAHEGTFLYFLLKLYEQEINIKNPHASSLIRKISANYQNSAPVLYDGLRQYAELFEIDERMYSHGHNRNFDRMTDAWINGGLVRVNYLHKSTGESCSCCFQPTDFFTCRKSDPVTGAAVRGVCQRGKESCALFLSDFTEVESLQNIPEPEDFRCGGPESFCPVSEYARDSRPDCGRQIHSDYSFMGSEPSNQKQSVHDLEPDRHNLRRS